MKKQEKDQIQELMAGMQCPKSFKCAKNGFQRLCKASDFGLEGYLDCLDTDPLACNFAVSFGDGHLCKCPLRVYLAKELKK